MAMADDLLRDYLKAKREYDEALAQYVSVEWPESGEVSDKLPQPLTEEGIAELAGLGQIAEAERRRWLDFLGQRP